jgi:hypothetical protein
MRIEPEVAVYVTTVNVDEVFADHTYQRPVDSGRAKKMASGWDRRLAGIIEVSDRGEQSVSGRYAVIDGQHRWAAAALLDMPPLLVANVHSGLTVAEEAQLFDRLNRERKQPTRWDHWKARRAAGDEFVLRIEKICSANHVVVDMAAQDGCISCVSTLERIAKIGGLDRGCDLLDQALEVVTDVWALRRDSLDAPIVHGLALILHHLGGDVDLERLVDTLLEVQPRRIGAEARALKDAHRGTLATLYAMAMMARYDRKPGPKLRVTPKDFGGGARNARSAPLKFDARYSELRDLGYPDVEIARKMGVGFDSFVRQMHRYKFPVSDVIASLAVEERAKREQQAS